MENPIVLISSGLLVQSDEGVSDLVMDRIDAIAGLTEIGLSMSKKIEKMKVKKKQVRANHVECHQKFQARIHEAEDSMQAQHLIIEALVDEKDSLLQTIHGLQEANNAPAPFDVGSRRANTRINVEAPRVDYYTRNQQRRVPYASAGLRTCWFSDVSIGFDDVEQENDIRTATEEDQQQLRNLFTIIHFRSGGSISCLNTQHDTTELTSFSKPEMVLIDEYSCQDRIRILMASNLYGINSEIEEDN
ncbi:hypothetical protein F511_21897 [Dorcoceras hygrometricum]|uniref:Uncharacterized protein n=1 Tax=Dorcoceras hygrometricum TaxID=472368 RepID=A0A2Z7ATI8_9LAMI|nr:hypothetical protein F511_21897 [Dorcoceras hygrometricum]